mgnify:FL=1
MIKNQNKKWFIIQIKPNAYEMANRNLTRQGFETFIPEMIVTSSKNNQYYSKKVFLFPGYMFVFFDPNFLEWKLINSTYGVSKILSFNNKPAEIPSDLILALKYRYAGNEKLTGNIDLKKGDRIKMITGPFVNFFAKVESVEGSNRIWVLLENAGVIQKLKLKNRSNIDYNKV